MSSDNLTGTTPTTPAVKPTLDEWNLICTVEEFWVRNKHFPGSKELAELSKLPEHKVIELLENDLVSQRLEILGIDQNAVPLAKHGELKRNQSRVTDKQLATAMTILNPMDKRSHTAKLKSLGVLPTTYNGWMQNKVFTDFMRQQASDMFGDAMPLAEEALVRKVMAGDTSAIKLYFEVQGRYSKNAVPTQDFRMLVLRLIEILQLHIKDPILLQLISQDVKQLIEPTPVAQFTQGEIVHGEYT